jgi:hypothetical protein
MTSAQVGDVPLEEGLLTLIPVAGALGVAVMARLRELSTWRPRRRAGRAG